MNLPIKPEVCIINGKLALFLGADYKLIDMDLAERFAERILDAIRNHRASREIEDA